MATSLLPDLTASRKEDTKDGSSFSRLFGGTGRLAICQWTHSTGLDAINGRRPVSIW